MLILQDPTDPNSTYLLESIFEACESATKVAGAFAFASLPGIRLVTQGTAFQAILENHEVDLVVGIDAVTNNAALDELLRVGQSRPNFQVRAFLNPRNDVIFHPKFCWTKRAETGILIAGSGNLTESGLLGNWEAYSLETLASEQLTDLENAWNAWTERHEPYLRPLDDPEVRSIATNNQVLAIEGDLPTLAAEPSTRDPQVDEPEQVLIAEIPRSGNRWKQANFRKADYEQFFGARVGVRRLVVFRHVGSDGTLSPYEHDRPSVEVASQNYRFELDAASGLPYPDEGRPIGVFIRRATRTFWYHLLMPGDLEYDNVIDILDESANDTDVRRLRMSLAELRRRWPTSPFWHAEGQ